MPLTGERGQPPRQGQPAPAAGGEWVNEGYGGSQGQPGLQCTARGRGGGRVGAEACIAMGGQAGAGWGMGGQAAVMLWQVGGRLGINQSMRH